MPVRSLRSSVLRWPDRESVHQAVTAWVEALLRNRSDIVRIGYFGSYARGDWGVGSDLDVVAVVSDSHDGFGRRTLGKEVLELPVSVDLIVYTDDEWQALAARDAKFYREVMDEAVWLYGAGTTQV